MNLNILMSTLFSPVAKYGRRSNMDVINDSNLTLCVNNVTIKRTVLVKYLGVWIDDVPSFKPHINNLVTNILI